MWQRLSCEITTNHASVDLVLIRLDGFKRCVGNVSRPVECFRLRFAGCGFSRNHMHWVWAKREICLHECLVFDVRPDHPWVVVYLKRRCENFQWAHAFMKAADLLRNQFLQCLRRFASYPRVSPSRFPLPLFSAAIKSDSLHQRIGSC